MNYWDASCDRDLRFQHIPVIIVVSAVPRSPNGKVDRAQLPLPPRAAANGGSSAIAFNSPIEELLARIWCQLLKGEHINAEDNFFDLGGDLLLALRLAYFIEETIGVRLGIPEIFKNSVFREMAQLLLTRSSSIRPTVITIQEGSPAERSIYFIYAASHEFGLARMLGVQRNVYGVEVGWLASWRQALERGDTSGYPTMGQLVEPFCSTILAHAGSRPFVVAGYSFAGLMAFETARQLKKRGASVDAVLLFDTVARAPSLLRVAWNEMKDMWTRKTQFDWAALTQAAGRSVRRESETPDRRFPRSADKASRPVMQRPAGTFACLASDGEIVREHQETIPSSQIGLSGHPRCCEQ